MSEAKLSYDYRRMLEAEPPTADENRVLIRKAYNGSDEEKMGTGEAERKNGLLGTGPAFQ